jgi:uncharacterized protein (TIGR04222 family)
MKYPMPELTYFDPLSIASLRGGKEAVMETAIFSLWNRKLVDIGEVKTPTKGYLIKKVPTRKMFMYPIEYEIYKFTSTSRNYSEILYNPKLSIRLFIPLRKIDVELEDFHLKRSVKHKIKAGIITIVTLAIVIIIGGAKLYLGVSRDKPVGFLMMILMFAVIGLPIGLNLHNKQTKLGSRYLWKLEEHFEWLDKAVRIRSVPKGIDPSYCVAIFGMESLEGASFLDTFRDALTIPKPVNSGCSSCSSCSSCGGCGGCGGGCGGCG